MLTVDSIPTMLQKNTVMSPSPSCVRVWPHNQFPVCPVVDGVDLIVFQGGVEYK